MPPLSFDFCRDSSSRKAQHMSASIARTGARVIKARNSPQMKDTACSAVKAMATMLQIPANTDNDYEQLVLNNGMKVTLVTIPGSEKAAAALSITAGAQDDSLAGLAHFTEHAVFLGSARYPEENSFKKALNKNGGTSNGSTSMDQTTFQFEVNKSAFAQLLDIWSQFFVKPLMRDHAVEREIQAVTAEDSKNRILDGRRLLQVIKDLMVPGEKYAKFSTGNVNTLAKGNATENAPELAAILKRFHQLHYKPANMALCLCGPQPIPELRSYAEAMFAVIENVHTVAPGAIDGTEHLRNYPPEAVPSLSLDASRDDAVSRADAYESKRLDCPGYPFRREALGTLLQLRPVKDVCDMTILFGMPPVRNLYLADPATLLSFVISYKGPGTLFAALQDLGWATSVGANTRTETADFSIFQIHVALTPAGYLHYESVLSLISSHVRYLFGGSGCGGVADAEYRRLWEEMRTMNALDFSFQEKCTPYALAPYLCRQMAVYPLEHVLSEGWLMHELDLPSFRKFAACLNLENAVTVLRNQNTQAWIGLDNDKCITPEHALAEYGVDLQTVFPGMQKEEKKEKGPNRVELNYGVPYHISRMAPHVLQRPYESLQQAALALPIPESEAALLGSKAKITSQFPGPNAYVCYDLQVEESMKGDSATRVLRSDPPIKVKTVAEAALVTTSVDGRGCVSASSDGENLEYQLIREQVWHSHDLAFRQPRSEIRVFVATHAGSDGHPVNSIISSVYHQLVARHLYPASVAGLSYSASVGIRGMHFSVSGYSPNLPQLLTKVMRDFADMGWWDANLDPLVVASCQDRQVRHLRSWAKERPDSQAADLLDYLMSESARYLPAEQIFLSESIDTELVRTRLAQLVSQTHCMWSYYHGDRSLSEADTAQLHAAVSQLFPLKAPAVKIEDLQAMQLIKGWGVTDQPNRARLLPAGKHVVLAMACPNPEEANSTLLVHFQTEAVSPRASAKHLFLRRLLHEPMFNNLRTKKQLGYIVSLGATEFGRRKGGQSMKGFTAKILSNRFDPVEMQDVLGEFLLSHRDEIDALSEDELSQRVEAIVSSLMDPPMTYREESSDFWSHILDQRPFDWNDRVIAELRVLTVDDIRACYYEWFLGEKYSGKVGPVEDKAGAGDTTCTRRSVAVMLFGKDHLEKLAGHAPYPPPCPSAVSLFPRPVLSNDTVRSSSEREVITLRSSDELAQYKQTLSYHHETADTTFGI